MVQQLSDVALALELQAHSKSDQPDVTVIRTKARYNRRTTANDEEWQRGGCLGEGGYGRVYLEECISGSNVGKIQAVKKLQKARNRDYHHELNAIALFSLGKYRDTFVQCFGWYSTEQHIFLSMEYLPHGDLQQYLDTSLPEQEAQSITSQVLEAVTHMHERNFTHRDLKPSNILVAVSRPNWWIKVADFGITKRTEEGVTALRTAKGTQNFAAPEIRLSSHPEYTNAVDIWGAGMISLLMLVGMANMDFAAVLRYSAGAERRHPDEFLIKQEVSSDARSLVRSLLQRDPADRPSASVALQHDWLSLQTSPANFKTAEDVAWSTADGLRTTLPTARWTTAQSQPASQDTIVPAQASTLQRGRPAVRPSKFEVSQNSQLERQYSYQSSAAPLDEGYVTNSGSVSGYAESDVRQPQSVTVKASIDRRLKIVEVPLQDLDSEVLPWKLRRILELPTEARSEIHWFSESTGDFERLNESQPETLREIVESAYLKGELSLKIIIFTEDKHEDKPPPPPPRPQHFRSASAQSAAQPPTPGLTAPTVPPRPLSTEPLYFPPPPPQYPTPSPPPAEKKDSGSWWKNFRRKEGKSDELQPYERPMYVADPTIMEIYVMILTGKRITFEVTTADTILNVKEKMYAKEGIPTYLQHLMFAGKELEDMHNLHQYEIQNHSILQLVLRLAR